MAERKSGAEPRRSATQFDDYVQSDGQLAAGAAAEIEKAKQLLDSGAITQAEFETMKQKALA